MKSKATESNDEKPESIDPSQPGAFRVQPSFPYNESDIVTAHIGLVQSETNPDVASSTVHSFHVQAYRVETENEVIVSPLPPSPDDVENGTIDEQRENQSIGLPRGENLPEQNESDNKVGPKEESSSTALTTSDRPMIQRASTCTRGKIKILIAIGTLLSAVVIIITVPITLSVRRKGNPSDRLSQIKAIVQRISSSEDLKNTSSPQARALYWLVHNDTLNVSAYNIQWIQQRYIMAVLFFSTGGNDSMWFDSCNFMQPMHECMWMNESQINTEIYNILNLTLGLSCNPFQNITVIHLNSNNLRGTIPMELGYISSLENIFMSFNNIWGTIPSTFGMLSMLRSVEIRQTNVTGTFPAFLLRTTSLINLVISMNRLYGTIPSVSRLSSLTNLDVTQNAFTGSIPGLPTSITDLDLSENKFTNRLPASFQSLTRLRTFLVHRNLLTGSLPDSFKAFPNLSIFSVNKNMLTGTISPEIWALPRLTLLGLGGNKFQGSLSGIGASASLQGLSVNNNNFSGSIPTDIGRLTNLYALAMERNQFRGSLPSEMGLLTNLMFLSFGDNSLSGTLPLSFQNLTQLVYLSIAGCQLNGTIDYLCSVISSNKPYIAADCKGGQFCPQGCCKTCCDTGIDYSRTCQEGQQYVDPLLIAYALFDRINKNVAW